MAPIILLERSSGWCTASIGNEPEQIVTVPRQFEVSNRILNSSSLRVEVESSSPPTTDKRHPIANSLAAYIGTLNGDQFV
jgi:hypothetical protein